MKLALTDTQKKNPHRAVNNSTFGSLSILERSFAEHRFDEIQYWDEAGVLSEAISGNSASTRNYASSLAHYLISGLFKGKSYGRIYREKNVALFDQVFMRLWELGARHQTQDHHTWLFQGATPTVMETLLDQGANPNLRSQPDFGESPLVNIINRFNEALGADKEFFSGVYLLPKPGDVERLEGIVDRCMLLPGATPTQLGATLQKVVRGGLSFKHTSSPMWKKWRDHLLKAGADVSLEKTVQALIYSGPYYRSDFTLSEMARGALETKSDQERANTNLKAFGDQLWEAYTNKWMDESMPWLQAILPALKKAKRNENDTISVNGWECLVKIPNGGEIGTKLLKSVKMDVPWGTTQQTWRPSGFHSNRDDGFRIITGHAQERHPESLRVLQKWAETKPVSSAWMTLAAKEYLSGTYVRGDQKKYGAVACASEIDILLSVSNWDPDQSVNGGWVMPWLIDIPRQSSRSYSPTTQPEMQDLLGYLHDKGVLSSMLDVSDFAMLSENERTIEWAKKWQNTPWFDEIWAFEDLRENIAKIMVWSSVYQGRDSLVNWLVRAREVSPALVDEIPDHILTAADNGNLRFMSALRALDAYLDLEKPFVPCHASAALVGMMARNAPNYSWDKSEQVWALRVIEKTGADLASCKLLNLLLEREATLPGNKYDHLVPMTRRLIELGDRPNEALLDGSGKLARDVGSTLQKIALEDATRCAPGRIASRRL